MAYSKLILDMVVSEHVLVWDSRQAGCSIESGRHLDRW